MDVERTIGQQVEDLFTSPGPAGMIPTALIPVLSAQIASRRDGMRAYGLHPQADRAEDVLDQLAHLYTRGIQKR